jgi:hypothetical protein|tara:strand:- start:871 stop:987 length:117 start_codon:yes stop_codon:yes gene_type:complete
MKYHGINAPLREGKEFAKPMNKYAIIKKKKNGSKKKKV